MTHIDIKRIIESASPSVDDGAALICEYIYEMKGIRPVLAGTLDAGYYNLALDVAIRYYRNKFGTMLVNGVNKRYKLKYE